MGTWRCHQASRELSAYVSISVSCKPMASVPPVFMSGLFMCLMGCELFRFTEVPTHILEVVALSHLNIPLHRLIVPPCGPFRAPFVKILRCSVLARQKT